VSVYWAHFEHEFWQFWADLSWQLITVLIKPYSCLLCVNSVVRYFVANNTFQRYVTIILRTSGFPQGKAVTWVGGKYLYGIQFQPLCYYLPKLILTKFWQKQKCTVFLRHDVVPHRIIRITKLVHWPLMGGLLHFVQPGGAWMGWGPAQAPPHCTKCNSPPINGQCTNHCSLLLYDGPLLYGFNVAIKDLISTIYPKGWRVKRLSS